MHRVFNIFGKEKSELAKTCRTEKDARRLREEMHAFFMSPETSNTSACRTLEYQRKLYLKYFSQIQTKESSSSLSSSSLSSTATLVEHDDIDQKTSPEPCKEEEEAPVAKPITQPRNLFRAPSLPAIQRPFAMRRRPTITLSSGIIAEPMFAEVVTPRPETKAAAKCPPRHDTKVTAAPLPAPRPKSEQYTKTEWHPASSFDTFRAVSHNEDTPLVSDVPSSETRSLRRSTARRFPNGPNKWIPPVQRNSRMQM